jgi:hypothetical protein
MGDVLLWFKISRPQQLIELNKVSWTASRMLAENSRCSGGLKSLWRSNDERHIQEVGLIANIFAPSSITRRRSASPA